MTELHTGPVGARVNNLFVNHIWGSLGLSLVIAGVVAYPVNRWLISRGQGHALVHGEHQS